MTLFQLSYAGLWIVALVLAVLITVMVSQFSRILRAAQLHENQQIWAKTRPLTAGERLRRFSGRELRSGAILGSDKWSGIPFVVVALSPTCGTCKTLVSELLSKGDDFAGEEAVIGLCVGGGSVCESAPLATVQSIPMLTVAETEVPEIVVTGLPLVIAVRADGIVNDVRHPSAVSEVAVMLAALRNDEKHRVCEEENHVHTAARLDVVGAP